MERYLGVVMLLLAAISGAFTSYVAGCGAYMVGEQVSRDLAIFSVFAISVVSAAKIFGACCLAFGASLVLQCSGGVLAVLAATVTGCASWVQHVVVMRPIAHPFEEILGWAPGDLLPFNAAHLAISLEVFFVLGLSVGVLMWREPLSRLSVLPSR
jgi:hypothetical protein